MHRHTEPLPKGSPIKDIPIEYFLNLASTFSKLLAINAHKLALLCFKIKQISTFNTHITKFGHSIFGAHFRFPP